MTEHTIMIYMITQFLALDLPEKIAEIKVLHKLLYTPAMLRFSCSHLSSIASSRCSSPRLDLRL